MSPMDTGSESERVGGTKRPATEDLCRDPVPPGPIQVDGCHVIHVDSPSQDSGEEAAEHQRLQLQALQAQACALQTCLPPAN